MSKKIIYLLSLLMALSLVFASCKKNSNNPLDGGNFTPEEDQDNTEGVVGDDGLVDDFSKLPTDKVIIKQTVFEGNGTDYLRNPVVVVMGEQSNTVVVFGEKRYKSKGADNDVGINGKDAVDIIYRVSTDAGTRFGNLSIVNKDGKESTAAKSHGAPVVFKVANDKVVVVASAGGGIARTSEAAKKPASSATDSKPASRIDYIVGTLSGTSITWSEDWKTIGDTETALLDKVQAIATPNSSLYYTQMGTHSAKGHVSSDGKNTLILPVVMAQQGTSGSGAKEMMGIYFVKGTWNGNITWDIETGLHVEFPKGNSDFSTSKEARIIAGNEPANAQYIAVPNPSYGNTKYSLGTGATQPKASDIDGNFGSPGYLTLRWFGKGNYDPNEYNKLNAQADKSLFMAVTDAGTQDKNLKIFLVEKNTLTVSGKANGYLVHEVGKSGSIDVLGDGTVITVAEEGVRQDRDKDFITKLTRYSQGYLASLIEN